MPILYAPTPATFLVQGQSGSQQFHLTIFLDKFLSCCVFRLVCLPERYLQLKKKKKIKSPSFKPGLCLGIPLVLNLHPGNT